MFVLSFWLFECLNRVGFEKVVHLLQHLRKKKIRKNRGP